MPNSARLDEIATKMAEVIAEDDRLDDKLPVAPLVLASVPRPELDQSEYPIRVYVDFASGSAERIEPQPITAMTIFSQRHTFYLWLMVYDDDRDAANEYYAKLLYNLLLILGDETDEDGYWLAGRVERMNHSATHPNQAATGDVRLRSGNLEFVFVQDLIL